MKGLNKAQNMTENFLENQSRKYRIEYGHVCSQIRVLQGQPDSPEKEEQLRMLERKKAYLEDQIEKFQSQGF